MKKRKHALVLDLLGESSSISTLSYLLTFTCRNRDCSLWLIRSFSVLFLLLLLLFFFFFLFLFLVLFFFLSFLFLFKPYAATLNFLISQLLPLPNS